MNILQLAAAQLPTGKWAVGVSGGADSVALLLLLHQRKDLKLHVVHLDHQTRGEESTGDARFVENLCRELKLPCTIARRDEIEPEIADLPTNPSAKYRAVRQELFRRVVKKEKLRGILLAHHSGDQAETVVLRLLRGGGSSMRGLAGMRMHQTVRGLLCWRPLLKVPPEMLRSFLHRRGQDWREDASNQSSSYARNRVRRWLTNHKEFNGRVLDLATALATAGAWARSTAPVLALEFPAERLAQLPEILARESARRWLIARGVPAGQLNAKALERLRDMAADAATPRRQQFSGRVVVKRNRGVLSATGD